MGPAGRRGTSLGQAPRWAGQRLLFMAVCLAVACGGTAQQTAVMDLAKNVRSDMSAQELRVRLNEYADTFAGLVEEGADEIIARSDDPKIERNALLWKTNAIAELQKSVFQSDPIAAGYDVWAFALQMNDFFRNGAGSALFGEQQPIAVDVSTRLKDLIEANIKSTMKHDVKITENHRLVRWARQHKIKSLYFHRQSPIAAVYPELIAEYERGRGGLSTTGRMEEAMMVLSERMRIYAASLPKQARWEAKLLVGDVLEGEPIRGLVGNLDQATKMLLQSAALLEQMPALIEHERRATVAALHSELRFSLAAVDQMRRETFAELQSERAVVLGAVERMRTDTIKQGLQGAEDTAKNVIGFSFDRIDERINRLFYRAAQLLVLGLLGLGIVVGMGMLWYSRRKSGKDKVSPPHPHPV